MRSRVEKLYKLMIETEGFPKEEEATVYTVLAPKEGEFDEEDLEVSEHELDTSDPESVKKFLDRTTREALEGDVKNLRLYCYVFEGPEGLKIVSDEEVNEEVVLNFIERMREEAL